MLKKYEYDGVVYDSELAVRKALYDTKKVALGKTPKSSIAEFWMKYDVRFFEEEESMEFVKPIKLMQVKRAFLDWRNNKATIVSSLGFKADANERANSDVNGLLVSYDERRDELMTFRDADNQFHELSYAQLKTLQREIVENGNFAYQQKWELDAKVSDAKTKKELDAIEICFIGKDFSTE